MLDESRPCRPVLLSMPRSSTCRIPSSGMARFGSAPTSSCRDRLRQNKPSAKRLWRRICRAQFPAAILIIVGSAALSRLQGAEGEAHVFVGMMADHGVESLLARKLFDALRHGLAHFWETKLFDVGRQEHVELVVSWKKKRHLSLRSSPSPGLYLNVRTMWGDLQKALTQYAVVLEGDPKTAGS